MITDFDDLCLYTYVTVDDILMTIEPLLRHPGPTPLCTDSELITMVLVAECKGWDIETQMLSELSQHPNLFPILPSQSRLNRRRRNLASIINRIRQIIVSTIEGAEDPLCVIDSLPVAVIEFHLVPGSSNNGSCYDADYGRVASKKQTIFGYKLHLLTTANGVIIDFTLAPASATDLSVGYELLCGQKDKQVIEDKAYINRDLQTELADRHGIDLITVPRCNQKDSMSKSEKRWINQTRQIIETVNGQLSDQFGIETNHAHSFSGLCTRLYSKLTAHTLCIYLNRLLKKTSFLQIKELAFPVPSN